MNVLVFFLIWYLIGVVGYVYSETHAYGMDKNSFYQMLLIGLSGPIVIFGMISVNKSVKRIENDR